MLAIEMIPKIFVIMAWTMVIGVQGDTENPVASDGSSGGDSFTEEFFTEIGNNVDLRCRLNGASFEWKRENGEAVPDKSFQAGRILRIPNVERSDEGRYVCTDDNGRIQYVKLVIAELRYKCYYWTDEDRVKMLQGGSINSNSNSIFEIERRICEGYENFVFTQGVDSKAPGCGNCRCCQPDNPDFIVGNVDTRCAMEALIMNIEDCRWAATAFNKTFNWGTKVKTYYTSGKTMVGSCYMDQHNDVYFKNVNYDFMSPLTKPICRRKETLEKKAKDEMFKEMIQTISTAKENKAQIQENKVQITYLKKKVKTVVVYGQWGMWSDSSTCSKSCGTGQKTRIRTCIQSPSTGELPCRGISSESINCNTESCPDNIVRDSQNDNKKCGEANSSHRLFRLNGKDANKNNCIAKCAKNEDCVAFSGIWNQWCIGCDVKLTTKHQGAIAFKKDTVADYVVGPDDSLCQNGMIDNPAECERAAKQLNFWWEHEEEDSNYPGGCYSQRENVYFNPNLMGTPKQGVKPICRQEDQEEVCFDVETFVVKWGDEMSWKILGTKEPCELELKSVGGNGPEDGSQHSSECCVPSGKIEYSISCEDSHGDGWHGGYLEIEGKRYCNGFSDGKSFHDTWTVDPVDCSWDKFGEWSECSEICGGGERSRSREVLIPAKYGGKACEGSTTQREACNEESCPDNTVRDSQNDNKKCGHPMMTSHRLFILNGNDSNEENCKAKCAQKENCVAFSGIWNKWCIGCDVNLTTEHQGALAFKKDQGEATTPQNATTTATTPTTATNSTQSNMALVIVNSTATNTSQTTPKPEDLYITGDRGKPELMICYFVGDDVYGDGSFVMKNPNWNNSEIGDKGPKGIERYLNELTFETNNLLGPNNFKIDWKGPFAKEHKFPETNEIHQMAITSFKDEGCGAVVYLLIPNDSEEKLSDHGGVSVGAACDTMDGNGYILMVDQGFIGDVWIGPQVLAHHILQLMTNDRCKNRYDWWEHYCMCEKESLLHPKMYPGEQRLDSCAVARLNKSRISRRKCLHPNHNS